MFVLSFLALSTINNYGTWFWLSFCLNLLFFGSHSILLSLCMSITSHWILIGFVSNAFGRFFLYFEWRNTFGLPIQKNAYNHPSVFASKKREREREKVKLRHKILWIDWWTPSRQDQFPRNGFSSANKEHSVHSILTLSRQIDELFLSTLSDGMSPVRMFQKWQWCTTHRLLCAPIFSAVVLLARLIMNPNLFQNTSNMLAYAIDDNVCVCLPHSLTPRVSTIFFFQYLPSECQPIKLCWNCLNWWKSIGRAVFPTKNTWTHIHTRERPKCFWRQRRQRKKMCRRRKRVPAKALRA